MTVYCKKTADFLVALNDLCNEHKIKLSTNFHGNITLHDLEELDNWVWDCDIVDNTSVFTTPS